MRAEGNIERTGEGHNETTLSVKDRERGVAKKNAIGGGKRKKKSGTKAPVLI